MSSSLDRHRVSPELAAIALDRVSRLTGRGGPGAVSTPATGTASAAADFEHAGTADPRGWVPDQTAAAEPARPAGRAAPAAPDGRKQPRSANEDRLSAPPGGSGSGAAGPLPGWTDRLPPALRAGRVVIDVRAVGALVLVGLLAVCLAATFWFRSRPAQLPAVPPRAVVLATPTTGEQVVVDVAGEVRRAGVVSLPAGSRVADAVEAAGGARGGADLSTLNLARVLVDGEQVLVGQPPVVPPPGTAASPGALPPTGAALVDLNTATLEQLEELPGIGPVLAERILEWRVQHGRFSSVDELREVSGIGDATFAELEPLVRV